MPGLNDTARAIAFTCLWGASLAQAGEVTIPHTFSAGTPALASQVNANFAAVETAVDGNAADIASLQALVSAQAATIATLQTQLNAVMANSVLALNGALSLGTDAQGNPTAFVTGVNVQIVNGLGTTDAVNGLGNLTIGYNETAPTPTAFCSTNLYIDQANCEFRGGIWAANQRTGSHNLIVGAGNAYTRHGGLIAGYANSTNAAYASVSGGNYNLARGDHSASSGGYHNRTDNYSSSVSGGAENHARAEGSSISGGSFNLTSGFRASVSGGLTNTAQGANSSVTGGDTNLASGETSSVAGGAYNTAVGIDSAVTGGCSNDALGVRSTVSGGLGRTANSGYDWVAGLLFQEN